MEPMGVSCLSVVCSFTRIDCGKTNQSNGLVLVPAFALNVFAVLVLPLPALGEREVGGEVGGEMGGAIAGGFGPGDPSLSPDPEIDASSLPDPEGASPSSPDPDGASSSVPDPVGASSSSSDTGGVPVGALVGFFVGVRPGGVGPSSKPSSV